MPWDIKAVTRPRRGYVFAKSPETINLRELFELTEGGPLFEDCFLRHCECHGTPENCQIYAQWHELTSKMLHTLEETSLFDATWNHPEHRFLEKPKL